MAIIPHKNETELMRKASSGDQVAFTELFNWYYKPLGHFVYKLTESKEQTEEIVQEAFVKIWLKREKLAEIEDFSKYMFVLCRHQAYAIFKKNTSEKVLKEKFQQHIVQETELEEMDNPAEEYRELIAKAVAKLPVQQQKAYRMSKQEGMKYEEIALEMGLSTLTVKKHIQLALQFIREDLSKHASPIVVVILTTPLLLG